LSAMLPVKTVKKLLVVATFGSASAFKTFPKNTLGPLAAINNQFPLKSHHDTVVAYPKADLSEFKCDLASPLDPSGDGLHSSNELFSNKRAIDNLIRRHQSLVRVPSVCYDDLGEFDDYRWEPFYAIPRILEEKYPLM
jgi:Gly-Xaa carboxypeptidase